MHDSDNQCPKCGTVTAHGACPVCQKATEVLETSTPPAPVKRPPAAPGMTLTKLYHKAVAEVNRLKEEIDNCTHDWVELEPKIGSCKIDLGEPRGTETVWILRQMRDCQTCGAHEARLKFAPDNDWSIWRTVAQDNSVASEVTE